MIPALIYVKVKSKLKSAKTVDFIVLCFKGVNKIMQGMCKYYIKNNKLHLVHKINHTRHNKKAVTRSKYKKINRIKSETY